MVRVEVVPTATGIRLTLIGAPGARINARLKPAFEFGAGRVARFDSPSLTPDSAYFADDPFAELPGVNPPVHGTIRASVCPEGEKVCRRVEVEL